MTSQHIIKDVQMNDKVHINTHHGNFEWVICKVINVQSIF